MQPQQRFDVVVIGAGPAGVAAARHLRSQHANYVVLEGRSRIGGRLDSRMLDGAVVDCGASWIHHFHENPENPLVDVVQELEIEELILKRKEEDQIYDAVECRPLNDKEEKKAEKMVEKFFERVEKVAEDSDADLPIELAGIQVIKEVGNLPPAIRRGFNALLNGTENYEAASFKELSAWDYNESDGDEDKEEQDFLPKGGYTNFIRKAADGLHIELNKVVVSVDYSTDNVMVKCADGSVYQCYCVIASLPLGVLKANTVHFHPSLPQKHQKSISSLGFGNMEKVIMSFSENFWGDVSWITIGHDERSNFSHCFNFSDHGKHILCTFMTEEFARKMQHRPDHEIISELLALFQRIFHNRRVKMIDAIVTHWHADEFARGSYSFVKVGSSKKDIENLKKPIDDKIWFVGEHVHRKRLGAVSGAWETGTDAAKQVIAVLKQD